MNSVAGELPLEDFTRGHLAEILAERRLDPANQSIVTLLDPAETGVPPNVPREEGMQFPTEPRVKQRTTVSGELIIEGLLPSIAILTSRRNVVCEFYLRGMCKRPNCSYYHPPPEQLHLYREALLGKR